MTGKTYVRACRGKHPSNFYTLLLPGEALLVSPVTPPPAAKRPHTQYNREKAEGVCLCRIGRQPWQRRRRGRGGTETQPRQRNTIPPLVSSSRGGSSSSLWEEFPSIGDCSVSREEGFLLSESGAGSKGPGRGGKIWELIEALTCLSK